MIVKDHFDKVEYKIIFKGIKAKKNKKIKKIKIYNLVEI